MDGFGVSRIRVAYARQRSIYTCEITTTCFCSICTTTFIEKHCCAVAMMSVQSYSVLVVWVILERLEQAA
jgi:hypothetical protein